MVHVQDGEFVRVRVPVYFERSLHIALGGVHAPFFTDHEGTVIAVVLRREEWERLAQRFVGADVEAGFRLVSLQPGASDLTLLSRLRHGLQEHGAAAEVLPAFHHDHLLVREDQAQRCLELITRILSE